METIVKKAPSNSQTSLELLYNVSREIATAFDLSTLLQRVLFLSLRTIGAISGTIIVVDDDGNPVASSIIHGDHVLDYSTEQLRATLDKGLAGWVVRHRQAVLIPDTSRDHRWLRRPDDAVDATGPKSAVSAPFLARDRMAGVITLVHPEPKSLTLDHLALIQAIADQAAVGVFNARLHAETLHQARVMTALAESATTIASSLKLSDVLQNILEQISQVLEVEAVSLALITPNTNTLTYQASTSIKFKILGKTLQIGQGIAGWVAQEGKGLIVPDPYEDSRFFSGFDQETGFITKAIACAPLRSEGEIVGVLEAINPKKGSFDADALSVLTGIGNMAGTAIRNAQLFEALEAAHKRYHDLFEGNINSIIITDWEGKILEANQQTVELTQYEKDAIHKILINEFHEINLEILGEEFSQISDGVTQSYESILCTKTGLEIPILVHVHSISVEGKSYLQWVFRDITARKELDQLREDFLSMIYHDLRSPLANVVSSLDVLTALLQKSEDLPSVQSLLGIAVRSTERIQRLTHSLLDTNRLEAGQPVVDRQPISVTDLVQDSLDAVMPIATSKSQNIQSNITYDIPPVYVNGDMIRRVIINLLENAVKFTPPQGLIQIGAKIEKNWVQLWIDDTGQGIPDEQRQRIFDKYTRLHGKGKSGGFGLGLAYCKLAVEGHGGTIWIEEAATKGSRFTFTLPSSMDDKESN